MKSNHSHSLWGILILFSINLYSQPNFVQKINKPLDISNVIINFPSNVNYLTFPAPIHLQDISFSSNSAIQGFTSNDLIKIQSDFTSTPDNQGLVFAKVTDPPFEVVLTNKQNLSFNQPDPNPYEIGKYKLMEFGIKLKPEIQTLIDNFLDFNTLNDAGSINPYNYDEISIEADFMANGSLTRRYGFYYKEHQLNQSGNFEPIQTAYPFRIRYCPDKDQGQMTFKVRIYVNGQQLKDSDNMPYEFYSNPFNLKPSNEKGPLQALDSKRLKYKESGQPFFAVGQNMNIGSGDFTGIHDLLYGLDDLYDKANFVRLRMDPKEFGIEWEELGVYGSERPDRLNSNANHNWKRQTEAYHLDQAVKSCAANELYFLLCLQPDATLDTDHFANNDDLPNHYYHWNQSPYKTIAGVNDVGGFLTLPAPFEYWKKKIHYIIARWGYSPYLSIYQVFNETDNIAKHLGGTNYKNSYNFRTWMHRFILDTRNFIKTYSNENIVTTGFAECGLLKDARSLLNSAQQLDNLDCYTCNSYQKQSPYSNWERKESTIDINGAYDKPFIFGENGIFDCKPYIDGYTDIEWHNSIWSSAMMDGFGASLAWYAQNSYVKRQHLRGVRYFMKNIPFTTNNFSSYYDDTRYFTINNSNNFDKYPPDYQWFYSVNESGSKAYGWLHNYTNWYAADPNYQANLSAFACIFPNPNPINSIAIVNPDFRISKLQFGKSYQIDFYHTYYSSNPYRQSHIFTSGFLGLNVHNTGIALANLPQGTIENGNATGFQPDYAFRIRRTGQSFEYRNQPLTEMDFENGDNDADSLVNNQDQVFGNDTITASQRPIHIAGVIDIHHNSYQFDWDFGNGQKSTDKHPFVTYDKAGNYAITLTYTTNINTVHRLKQAIHVLPQKSRTEINEANNLIKLYPNPVKDVVNIENISSEQIQKIEIMDAKGQLVKVFGRNEDLTASFFSLNIKELPNGLYLLKVTFLNKNTSATYKLTKISNNEN